MSYIDLSKIKNAVIVGASSGIGLALCENLLTRFPNATVHATYRDKARSNRLFQLAGKFEDRLELYQLEAIVEDHYIDLVSHFSQNGISPEIIINSIGWLHSSDQKPEKRLADINEEQLLESIKINTLPTLYLAKHLFPLLKKGAPSVFATISAKVGSISDNRLGGWYSYRTSKAALNMSLKNISLEFERMRCPVLVLSIHPGTTKTKLSEPFIAKTPYTLHEPSDTAQNILNVIGEVENEASCQFLDWQGHEIPW